ncbi:ADP-ribose pyrophosphatase, mitochondrial [Gryllus bimaculatus]|nr:ADP-ribose pyrophosphatase, mitochondrial [Gryllus bimaculatus]
MSKKIIAMVHVKCRSLHYPRVGNIIRLQFPDNLVPWNSEWPDYKPNDFTASFVLGKPWADQDVSEPNFCPKWNSIDGNINRQSFMGEYRVKDKRPLNPVGRTGLCGRGVLGRWGPNHAADPIVTRWKRISQGAVVIHPKSKKKILQFVAIQRRDSGEWALPGGMVDPGEVVSATLKREFLEEACRSLENPDSLEENNKIITSFFDNGEVIYTGYVDDPRNTDNAWMETVAMNFHDDDGSTIGAISLEAGDDAMGVCWMDASQELHLYASHSDFIAKVAAKHGAHW